MKTILNITTAPAVEPVVAADMYKWLHLATQGNPPTHRDDDIINVMLKSARVDAEALTGRTFISTIYEQWLSEWPDSQLELPRGPHSAVASIKYLDANLVEQTLATTVYGTILPAGATAMPGQIYLKSSQTWPSLGIHPYPIKISFTAGYGAAASNVPEGIKAYIRARAATMYESREEENIDGNTFSISTYRCMIDPYIIPRK
jgi:uncharacterized phiE125 gp8 family phage protein